MSSVQLDFQQQLDNPNIKAIWCVKGGYGTVRIIDSDFTNFKTTS
jgi:muramoyltetrapeptide carboxypeptidase